ncbi:MAG: NAD(P)H-hydrate dehydratase [Burkholderia sp.]
MIVDADALHLIATHAELNSALVKRGVHHAVSISTPHPLEAARLLGTHTAEVQGDRLAAARELAARFHAIAVLKGWGHGDCSASRSRRRQPDQQRRALHRRQRRRARRPDRAAFAAQRLPAWEAALAGVCLHGLAADCLTTLGTGPVGLATGELGRPCAGC